MLLSGAALVGLTVSALGATHVYANIVGLSFLLVLALRDLGVVAFRLPTRHRQVPMAWKYLPGNWSPFVFGFALGIGVSTTIYLASFYAMAVIAVMVRSFELALVLGGIFGLARVLPVVVSGYTRQDPDGLIALLARHTRAVSISSGVATMLASLGWVRAVV